METLIMREIPEKILDTFDELKESLDFYIQLKYINGYYYVYRATSKWDSEEKKVKKITTYFGRITYDGEFLEKESTKRITQSSKEIYEYGNVALAHHLIGDAEEILRKIAPYPQDLIAMAILKAIDPMPLRLLSSQWSKMYLSKTMNAHLSPNHISSVLRVIGSNVSSWYELFSLLTPKDDLLLYDLTAIMTYSENIKMAEKGYNSNHSYLDQIGVVMAFSNTESLPIGLEVFHGSMRDVKTIRDFVQRLPKKDIGFIFDRGFSSYELLDELREDHINYIVPLKKNSVYLEVDKIEWTENFLYRDRPIRCGKLETPRGTLFCYEDPELKGEQESTLLRNLIEGKIKQEEYDLKKQKAGIIGVITDLDKKGKEIFELWKGREEVELAFDALKNELDFDKTYLQTDEGVRGYFFVSFLALRIYFGVLKRLRSAGLNQKISVNEVFFELSKVMKIVEKDGREYFAKIPKKSEKILALFSDMIYMG